MPEVSIIVPVYNVARYIKQCLNSIIAQTYTDFEAILVDDGSTDGSATICDEYALKDSRFKVIHQQNAGLSGARNTGIKNGNGKYFYFLDADDWIDESTIEGLHYIISQDKGSFVVCGYHVESARPRIIVPESITPNTKCEDIMLFFARKKLSYAVWNKMYDSEIILRNGILFYPGIKFVEDHSFNLKYICFCDGLRVLPLPLYHYRIREGQITGEDSLKKLPIYVEDTMRIIDDFTKQGQYGSYKHVLIVHFINRFSEYFGSLMSSETIQKKEKLKTINKVIELYQKVGFGGTKVLKTLTLKEKVFRILVKFGKARLIYAIYFVYGYIVRFIAKA